MNAQRAIIIRSPRWLVVVFGDICLPYSTCSERGTYKSSCVYNNLTSVFHGGSREPENGDEDVCVCVSVERDGIERERIAVHFQQCAKGVFISFDESFSSKTNLL